MATKRMLSQHVIVTDDFLRLPPTAMVLYFFLNLTADDDGFNSAPEDVMRRTRSSQDDLRLLIEKRFILAFNSGVVVIRHWLINNTLRKDTYHQTLHVENDQIGVNRAGEYEHLELLPSGEKSLEDYVRINQGQPLSRKKIKEIKQQLLTGESVEFEFDTNPVNVGESREEESRQGESGNVDGIPYNKTHLYGDEQNVLLDNEEIEKIYAKYVNPRKLINKVSYILLNSKTRKASHYAYINKIALEDGWPRKTKRGENTVVEFSGKEIDTEQSLRNSGATEEQIAAVMEGNVTYGQTMAELAKDRLKNK